MNEAKAKIVSSFLDKVADEALTIFGNDSQLIEFSKALQESLRLDIDNDIPNPASSSDLYSKYAFSKRLLKEYGICLNKQAAKKFLRDFGFPIKSGFDNTFNRAAFQKKFGREPFCVRGNEMLLTYAEWLHFVNFEFEPEFPEALKEYKDK